MVWSARASVAILLALAFATIPLLLDQCAGSCGHALAAASPSEPACHHAGVPTARIGHRPTRCGRDHETAVTALGDPAAPTLRAVALIVAVTSAPTANLPIVISRVATCASPPPDPLSRQLPVSLRI